MDHGLPDSNAMSLSKDVERRTEDREVEFRNFLILLSDTCMNCVFSGKLTDRRKVQCRHFPIELLRQDVERQHARSRARLL